MRDEKFKRKLTAILSADATGYSRLMGQDDVATVQLLKRCQKIMDDVIRQHHGRIIDSPGDNLLAEFPSVVEAAKCALVIQDSLQEPLTSLPEDRKMRFRIGINLGDVIVDGDRIYGDGVNIAARLEGLAPPGGICISGSAYDQIQNKMAFNCNYIGEQKVKNIAAPIRAYTIKADDEAAGTCSVSQVNNAPKHRLRLVLVLATLAVAVAVAIYLWLGGPNRETKVSPSTASQMASGATPEKPSIGVLPFNNFSADKEQDFFCDGITSDIITDLTKFRQLSVTAAHTVFQYKGKSIDIRKLGRELNVGYLLKGSIQKTDDRIRINVQLIDTAKGDHVWADRYNEKLENIFLLQDKIIQTIVSTLAIQIGDAERLRVMRKDTRNYRAYDYYIHGIGQMMHRTRSANSKARRLLEKAIEIDPEYASAYAALGWYYALQADFGWTEFIDQSYHRAMALAQKALNIDNSQASAYELRGSVYARTGQYDLAVADLQHALELNPNDVGLQLEMGHVFFYSGQTERAIQHLEKGLRFNLDWRGGIADMELGLAYYLRGRYEDAVNIVRRGMSRQKDFVGHYITLAAVYAQMGRVDDAENAARKVLKMHPFFEVNDYGSAFRDPSDREKIADGLRKAGLK